MKKLFIFLIMLSFTSCSKDWIGQNDCNEIKNQKEYFESLVSEKEKEIIELNEKIENLNRAKYDLEQEVSRLQSELQERGYNY